MDHVKAEGASNIKVKFDGSGDHHADPAMVFARDVVAMKTF